MSFLNDGTIGVNLGATPSTTSEFTLGASHTGTDGTKWLYVKSAGAISQYDYVTVDEDMVATQGAKAGVDDGHIVAFAQVAFSAADEYGWVALAGTGISTNVLGSCAADVALYTSGTAGALDDSSTSQTKIDGVVLVTANASSTAQSGEIIATYPKSTTF